MNPLKVQFGCGGNRLEGFENWDADCDITKPLPYPDNTVDFILAEHVVEHVKPAEALCFLDECKRILKPRGTVRICMPVLDYLSVPHGRDICFGHGHLGIWSKTSVFHLIRMAGFSAEKIIEVPRNEYIDGHWRVIGREKDQLETVRYEARK